MDQLQTSCCAITKILDSITKNRLLCKSTHIVVELARDQETEYISRSQAKRILVGLEKFHLVVLDFRNVRTVGQAFVDEVFRVFGQDHPEVKFEHINANENVEFMILRGVPPVKA